MPATRLELEITENAILRQGLQTTATLQGLRDIGVTLAIAIEGFCTGYSSLTSLQKLAFDRLKIDRSFISQLPDSSRSLALVRAIESLGKALGLEIVAEGAETPEQLDCVQREGCDSFQGFLVSRPAPLNKAVASARTFTGQGSIIPFPSIQERHSHA